MMNTVWELCIKLIVSSSHRKGYCDNPSSSSGTTYKIKQQQHMKIYGVYISQLIRFARVCSNVDDFNNRNLFLTAKLLKQGYRYHKIRKAFSKFYHRHSELIVKYNIRLKTLLQQGISEPIFYGDLVYKFKRIVGKPNFSDQFKKIVKRYIRVGYNLDIMRQSACLVLNPITVYSYGFLFNCTTVGQASDSMTALT